MAASNLDKFKKSKRKFETTVGIGGILAGGTTLPLTSVTGLDTSTAVTLVIGAGTATEEVVTGVVSGSDLINCVRGKEGTTDSAHSAGETVNMFFTETHWDDAMDGILVDHDQSGQHKNLTDANGNEWIKQTATASAVNEITVANAATGNGPVISATGGDTNIDIVLTPKGTGTVKTSAVNKIDWTALPLGSVVQCVYTQTGAVATGTTTMPLDDTIPQNTEGTEFMTLAITPKSTANILMIEVIAYGSYSINETTIAALFQDTTANALAAISENQDNGTGTFTLPLSHTMVAGTTSATTFKVRIGGNAAGTFTFNGIGGTRRFGGVAASSIKITEYKA